VSEYIRSKFKALASLPFFLVTAFASFPANAASTAYFLDLSNDLDDGINYAQVTISDSTETIGDIEFQVQVLTDSFPQPLSNFGMQAFYFNHADDIAITSANIVDIDPSAWLINHSMNAGGGFGKFDLQASGTGSSRTELLTFSITGINGDTIFDYALGNADDTGEFFAAKIAGYDDSLSGNTSGKFAGSTPVPVPAAVWLFGSALAGLGWMRRRQVV